MFIIPQEVMTVLKPAILTALSTKDKRAENTDFAK